MNWKSREVDALDARLIETVETVPSGFWFPGAPPTQKWLEEHFATKRGYVVRRPRVYRAWRRRYEKAWCTFVGTVIFAIRECSDPSVAPSGITWALVCDRVGISPKFFQNLRRIARVRAAFRNAAVTRKRLLLQGARKALANLSAWLTGALTKEKLAEHLGISYYLLFTDEVDKLYQAKSEELKKASTIVTDRELIRRIRAERSTHWVPDAPPTWLALTRSYNVNKRAFSNRKAVVKVWKQRLERSNTQLRQRIFDVIETDADAGVLSWDRLCERVGVELKFSQNIRKIPGVPAAMVDGLRRSVANQMKQLVKRAEEALRMPHRWLNGGRLSRAALARHLGTTVFRLETSELESIYNAAYAKYVADDRRMVLAKHLSAASNDDGGCINAPSDGSRPLSLRPACKAPNRTVAEAFEHFVRAGKKSPALKGVMWDSLRWEPSSDDSSNKLKRSHRSVGALVFSNRESSTGKGSGRTAKIPMVEPYLSFAKAEVKLYQEAANVTFASLISRGIAHRFLEKAFREHGLKRIADLTLLHFHLAEEAVDKSRTGAGAYSIALCLAGISDAIDHWRLTQRPIAYRVRLKEPERADSLTREGQELGKRKMVSREVLSSLAEIANAPPNDDARFLIRMVEILLVGGFRIGEVLTLPDNCVEVDETREIYTNAATGERVHPCAITYAAEKASDFRPKPLSPSAVPVALRAINELQKMSRPAREMARWLEKHPGRLKPFFDLHPDAWISCKEACRRLGFSDAAYCSWVRRGLIRLRHERPRDSDSQKGFRVGDIELLWRNRIGSMEVLRMPSGRTLMLSETLIVTFEMDWPWFPRSVSYSMFAKRLCPDKWHRVRGKSGLLPEGFQVTSHQFRHWLNTIADEGGLSEIDIAQFFGRKSLSQSATYKHGTVVQRAEAFKELIRDGKVYGLVGRIASALSGDDLEKFINAAVGIVHVTPIGLCTHDFSALPCQQHHVCFRGCKEYGRVRGDIESRNTLLKLRRSEVASLETSTRLLRDEYAGDNEFVSESIKRSRENISGIDAALAIDDIAKDFGDGLEPVPVFPDSKTSLVPL